MTRPHPHKIKGKRVISKSTYCLYGNNATFIFEASIDCVIFSMILLSDHVVWWQTFEEEQVQPMIQQEGKRCWCLIWKRIRLPEASHKVLCLRKRSEIWELEEFCAFDCVQFLREYFSGFFEKHRPETGFKGEVSHVIPVFWLNCLRGQFAPIFFALSLSLSPHFPPHSFAVVKFEQCAPRVSSSGSSVLQKVRALHQNPRTRYFQKSFNTFLRLATFGLIDAHRLL